MGNERAGKEWKGQQKECAEDGNEQTYTRGRAEETEPVKEGRDEEVRNISGQNSVLLLGHPIINSK